MPQTETGKSVVFKSTEFDMDTSVHSPVHSPGTEPSPSSFQ